MIRNRVMASKQWYWSWKRYLLFFFSCKYFVNLHLHQYLFDHLQQSQSLQNQGFTLPVCHRFCVALTEHTGASPPNESGKRERRSNCSSEFGSPVSKGTKRVPSHGIWSVAAHRDSWLSNISAGADAVCNADFLCSRLFCSNNMRQCWILLVCIGIEGCRNVNAYMPNFEFESCYF